jgi:hypothetical protein
MKVESVRVAVLTHGGSTELGYGRGWFPDGTVYVVLDSGGSGNFPVGSVRVMEDKDKPREGFEVK